ncbi:MAG: hypothetical protein FJ320_07575 [SAR202 cluster bacterium]|nr:hypothetical protein [SAR202 cluster bacterium]
MGAVGPDVIGAYKSVSGIVYIIGKIEMNIYMVIIGWYSCILKFVVIDVLGIHRANVLHTAITIFARLTHRRLIANVHFITMHICYGVYVPSEIVGCPITAIKCVIGLLGSKNIGRAYSVYYLPRIGPIPSDFEERCWSSLKTSIGFLKQLASCTVEFKELPCIGIVSDSG